MITENKTTMSGFLLMGFSANHELQILHALLLLVIYLLALAGNLIIIAITTLDQCLQSPMYYFLKHLSLLDLSFISVTVPQSIDNSLMDDGCIFQSQCLLQVFSFTSLAWAEVAVLIVMSHDHYAAICLPLHYKVTMDPGTCKWAVIAVWPSGAVSGILYTAATFSITFRRDRIIHEFFCDVPQLLKLSCANDFLGVTGAAAFRSEMAFTCFTSTALSYIHIFSTVLKMPPAEADPRPSLPACLTSLWSIFSFHRHL